jgi:hypothetical protein
MIGFVVLNMVWLFWEFGFKRKKEEKSERRGKEADKKKKK